MPAEFGDRLVDSLPKPGGSRRRGVQVEDRRLDFLYHSLQVVDGFGSRRRTSGSRTRGTVPCSRQADREQPLYHVVVEFTGNTVPLGDDVEFAHPALRGGQLPGQRRLVGERGHHLHLFVGERARTVLMQHHNDSGDRIGGP